MGERIKMAAQTDIGCYRKNNEDRFAYDLSLGIFAVSDGMGGCAGGEVASQLAVEQLIVAYRLLRNSTISPLGISDALYHAIISANTAVYERARRESSLAGMGATLVAIAVEGSAAVIANIGDSRAYLLRESASTQITLDHSFVAEQVRAGTLRAEDAANSLLQSTITRAIGIEAVVEADLFAAQLEVGDRVLLTSDGLTRYVRDEEIAAIAKPPVTPEAACAALIELARSRGGADNVTCLLLLWEG
ncbi:protein phosphatase 2C domain-containing protein [Granulicella sp. dw_53]|uniref:PP2C family protein-serine/threonine phosphatase n=1 Tax=Granulicella sp. dw_53 TaxID=2719792 RepID=UPI001BD41CA9|nr:protein phosphatase 2C domain-containing protein [Granulicella sp. dw_53]